MFASKDIFLKSSGGGYQISRSVRLRSSASAYLNRTPASASNRKTWTWSGWVKRGTLTTDQRLFEGYVDTSNWTTITFEAADRIQVAHRVGGTSTYNLITTAVYRDPSAWYHIVVAFDTTQATSANRVKLYVNGTQITVFTTNTIGAQNVDTFVDATNVHHIGRYGAASQYLDGYLTEINFIDGQALTPSSFGETNAVTGVWQPKKYGGTYGTNGFYLNFSDNSTAAALGTDFSGNSNTWTVNNISVTAGVTYDSMLDVPTPYADGGNGRGNYAVMNPNDQAGGLVVADGNLKVTAATGWDGARATFSLPSTGKWYWEALCIARSTGAAVGILGTSAVITGDLGAAATGYVYNSGDGNKYNNGSGSAYGATWTTNDIIGIAWDADTGTLSFYKNGTSQGTAYSSLTGQFSPAIGVNGSDSMAANFGQRPFSYTPPTGFVALNTQNLPTPTINNGAGYMAATLFNGVGAAQNIYNTVNGVSFQPDLVWMKARSVTENHQLFDSVRGVQKSLYSNLTNAETTDPGVYTFNTNGFNSYNASGQTYVGWQWNAGGSTVTNTSGSISAQVRANPTAGFSVVTYTGTGANATVGHGLGVAPSMIILKSRVGATNWVVYHANLTSAAYVIQFNLTNAQSSSPTIFNSTAPTSSVFSIGTSSASNDTSMVAYCFAAVAGYSAFGSYTGNGSTNGVFVFLGFRPRFVMVKQTNAVGNWIVWDTSRSTYNQMQDYLLPNSSAAEANNVLVSIDFLSNGFKCRTADDDINGSGDTYIYMAFAENPFKLSLAR
jgi:hypothetical protein